MSRIGRLPIPVPSGVTVTLDGPSITVKGPKGELRRDLHPDMLVAQEPGRLVVSRPDEDKFHRQLHGLTRTLVANKGRTLATLESDVRTAKGKLVAKALGTFFIKGPAKSRRETPGE